MKAEAQWESTGHFLRRLRVQLPSALHFLSKVVMAKIKMIFRVVRQLFRCVSHDMEQMRRFERVFQIDLQQLAALNRFARTVGRTGFTCEQARRRLLKWIRSNEDNS